MWGFKYLVKLFTLIIMVVYNHSLELLSIDRMNPYKFLKKSFFHQKMVYNLSFGNIYSLYVP